MKYCLRLLLLIASLGAASLLLAQADRATIEGIVTDPSGAAIADATVNITRIETSVLIPLKTNEVGRYYAANLPLGTYRVTVEKTGFRGAQVDNLILQSQMNVRADVRLEVGSMTERVDVTAEGPMLDASTATITAQLTTKQIQELPLIVVGRKRDITAYLAFLPGVTTTSTWGARVNGSNPGNSEVFLDGAPASQGNVRGGIQENGPSVEQVGEFSVVTNSFNAEYGRTGSWFTNITIRSGTNQIHGSVFDFFDNDALNARSFFQKIRSRVRHNEGGFTLGAPVYLPKIYDGRNKTFFFFGQQLVYYTNTESGSLFTVPRADFRSRRFQPVAGRDEHPDPDLRPLLDSARRQGRLRARPVCRATASGRVASARYRRNIVALIPQPDLPYAADQQLPQPHRLGHLSQLRFHRQDRPQFLEHPQDLDHVQRSVQPARDRRQGLRHGQPARRLAIAEVHSRPHRPHQLRLDRAPEHPQPLHHRGGSLQQPDPPVDAI